MLERSSVLPLSALLAALLMAGCASNNDRVTSGVTTQDIINPVRGARGNPESYEVFGQRYRVLRSSDGYSAAGVASWYGPDFHGNSTSSGERYDMHELTAAHKTLPIPTWVEVTNRNNGRSVIVKVNDRGPFVDDRLIDLSYAAATELDMIRDGTAPVLVRALGAPARFSEVSDSGYSDSRYVDSEGTREVSTLAGVTRGGTASTAVVPGSTVGTFLQVGAFSARRNAENLLRRLEANGVDNAFVLSDSSGAGNLYRVRVGPLVDSVQLDDTMTSLQRIGIGDAHLVIGR